MTDHERLNAVRQALTLDAGRDCNRLGWLASLLNEVTLSGWADHHKDVSAAYECLNECQALLDGLTAAFQDELDAQLEAGRVALGEVPGPDDDLPF